MEWDIEPYIIFEAIVGSHAYGTNDELSDEDYRGVCIPPLSILLGFNKFEQKDGWDGKYDDRVIYNISKFFTMCLKNNPAIIELFFLPESVILRKSYIWDQIVSKRDLFLSKNITNTFSGYAHAQLHRIKRHRGYLLNPIKEEPKREKFGLSVNPTLNHESLSAILSLSEHLLATNIKEEASKESSFRQAKKMWDDYIAWEKGRNKKRSELELNFGYDVKHASHLIRLMEEGEELLIYGKITLPRPNVDFLLDIKKGKFSYDQILEMVEGFDEKFSVLSKKSVLPYSPNFKEVNELYLDILADYFMIEIWF